MKYKIIDKATKKELDYSKYALTAYGDVLSIPNGLVLSNSSDFIIEPILEHDLVDLNSKNYQLKMLQNIERTFLSKALRKRTQNVWLVQSFLTSFTSKGGSTSSFAHCDFLGIDPNGYTFF